MSKESKIVTIEKDQKEIIKIAEIAAKEIKANNNIFLTNYIGYPTVVKVLIQELFNYVNEQEENCEINFLELFILGKDEEGLYMVPGPSMKLLVKSDDETEE